jgi:hypothetical protein
MSVQQLNYEQVVSLRSEISPVLVTATLIDEIRGQVTEESHVFVPTTQKYIQQTCYRSLNDFDSEGILARATQNTRRLFFDCFSTQAVIEGLNSLRFSQATMVGVVDHPFHRFKIEGKFTHEMWEIQEWSCSSALRSTLAEVMSYRCDPLEAELLNRVFCGDENKMASGVSAVAISLFNAVHRRFKV